jgi:phage tail sheath protein FI
LPTTLTYPGVYIEEVPSGVHPITGVATSIAAFVDVFRRGPLNRAVEMFSFADFEREFGGLDAMSESSYAIQQFFLNGGSDAWVVRTGDTATLAAANVMLRQNPGGGAQIVRASAGRRVRGNAVADPGVWGNSVRIEADFDVAVPTDPLQSFDELFNLTVSEISAAPGRLTTLRSETYRNLTMRMGARNNAVEVVNESSKIVQLDRSGLGAVPANPSGFRPAATGTLGAQIAASTAVPASGATIHVNSGGGLKVATIAYTGTVDLATYASILEAALQAADPNDPLIAGATVRLIRSSADGTQVRFHVLAGRGGATFDPTATLTFTNAAGTTAGDLGLTAVPNVQQVRLAGGVDAPALTANVLRGSRAAKTALYALEDVDLFNILCVPAASNLNATNAAQVFTEFEAYCLERRAFLLVDIPATVDSPPDMQAWLTNNANLRSRNAAVYFPRPLIPDPLNDGRLRNSPASGTIAGLYARIDAARGVWKAPAGTEGTLRNVLELAYVLTDPENGVLNPLGANCLRMFPVYGNVSWGARTLDGADAQASEWKYVPVRRLALFLEESLFRGTKWVVFEPNDEPLWAQIRLNLGAFMHSLFRQGAFQGTTPREAYFVKCDKETTTQTDINNGVVNILVGFAPLKPAEFVIIKIQQLAGQIET